MYQLYRVFLYLGVLVLLLAAPVMADAWLSVETEHFVIHFSQGYNEVANRAAAIAEEIYSVATTAIGHVPDEKTQIVLKDVTDSANGFSRWSLFNGMSLYAAPFTEWSALTSGFPQKYDSWLYSLILHEYIHVLHLDMNEGLSTFLRGAFGRVPIITSLNSMQSFAWIEGLAVYHETRLANGGRASDPLYQMFLRANVLDNNLPEIDQVLGYYDLKEWKPAGGVYLYGVALVEYIADTYGAETLVEINKTHAAQAFPSLNLAMEKVLGKPLTRLWDECREWVRTNQGALLQRIDETGSIEGTRLTYSGEKTGGPDFLPNGDVLYLADSRRSFPAVRLREADGGDRQLFSQYGSLSGRPRTDAAGSEVVFSESYPQNFNKLGNDIVLFDLQSGKKERLTIGARAVDPAPSPDGFLIAYVKLVPYSAELVILDRETGVSRTIPLGETVQSLGGPAFSPDGTRLAISIARQGGWQDIAVITLADNRLEWITSDSAADLSPVWSSDGRYLFYSSDQSGVYDIYAYQTDTADHWQITRVRTGAFQPAVKENRLIYTGYTSEGFDLFELDLADAAWIKVSSEPKEFNPVLPLAITSQPAQLTAKPYESRHTLAPKYWVPVATFSEEGAAMSILTSGEDAVGHQAYKFQAGWDFGDDRPLVDATYSRKGSEYGPQVNLGYSNLSGDQELLATVSASSGRRTVFSRGIGVSATWPELDNAADLALTYDAAISHTGGAGPWSILAQTGFAGHHDLDGAGQYVLASTGVSLANQGRKTLAGRVAAGWAENHRFEVGGVSTQFPVRGLATGAVIGDRAVAATVSWRPWELQIERGYSDIPFFFNSVSVDLFADAAAAGFGQLGAVQAWSGVEVNVPIELLYGTGGVGYSSASTLRLTAGYALPISSHGEGKFYFAASLPLMGF